MCTFDDVKLVQNMMLDYLYLQLNWCFSLKWEETLCMHVVVPLPTLSGLEIYCFK